MSFAGARRTTGASRRRSPRVGHARAARRPRPIAAPIGPSASRRASHSPTASVCGRRSGSIPAAASAAVDPAGVDGQLPRQDVVEHLAALAERRLDEPPQLVLVVAGRGGRRRVRLDHDHRRLDRRLRLEGLRRDADAIRTRAWYWTKTDR